MSSIIIGIRFVWFRFLFFSLFVATLYVCKYIHNVASHLSFSLSFSLPFSAQFDWLTQVVCEIRLRVTRRKRNSRKNLSLFHHFVALIIIWINSLLCSECDFDLINTYTSYTHKYISYGRHLTRAYHVITTLYSFLCVCVFLFFKLNAMIIMISLESHLNFQTLNWFFFRFVSIDPLLCISFHTFGPISMYSILGWLNVCLFPPYFIRRTFFI